MNSSHIPDSYGMGNAVDIACTNSKDRYELMEVAQKFFRRIGIAREGKGARSDLGLLIKSFAYRKSEET